MKTTCSPLLLLPLIFSSSVLAAKNLPAISNTTCSTDDDCTSLNAEIPGWSTSTKTAGYLCVPQADPALPPKCTYKVGAGEICNVATDCAAAEYMARAERSTAASPSTSSSTIYRIPDALGANVTSYIAGLCSRQYCTIQSTCDSYSDPLFPSTSAGQPIYPFPAGDESCCGGAQDTWPCAKLGGYLDTCGSDEVCTAKGPNNHTCVSIDVKSQQWIGIVLTLLGAATLNIGLNLQKLALRKRNEQIQEKKAEARSRFRRVTRGSFKFPAFGRGSGGKGTFGRFCSGSSASKAVDSYPLSFQKVDHRALGKNLAYASQPSLSGTGNSDAPPTSDVASDFTRSAPSENKNNSPLVMSVHSNNHSETSDTMPGGYPNQDAGTGAQLQEDDVHLQKKLDFANLIQNPTWILGLAIFVGGNIINFVALQFAPQSLVAPLGSISLVVNVVVAPWINEERWGWKDVMGVILIVGGSSMVVAFSGYAAKDYKLCVLLALFSATDTIVFLTVTGALIVAIFFLIVTVEKNVDFGVPGATARSLQKEGVASYDALVHRLTSPSQNKASSLQTSGSSFDSMHRLLDKKAAQPSTRSITTVSDSSNSTHTELPTGRDIANVDKVMAADKISAFGALSSPRSTPASSMDTIVPSDNNTALNHHQSASSMSTISSVHLAEWVKPPNDPRRYPRPIRKLSEWWHSMHIIPRFRKKMPLSSPWVVIALPFAYASLGGLMGTITVLFAKSTSYLLNISFGGNNQYNNFFAFLITGITIVTAVAQVYWINMGLQRYDALLQIPVYFVVWTLFDVIGGGIYFNEFKGFTPKQYGLFIMGVSIIFAGVIVLADRLKKIEVDDRMIANANISAMEHTQDQEMTGPQSPK
ncbi:hypothetical protein SeLEV6574_g03766 [Synchytrium endobioticum]|uniref:EamA domain-containing protein n=1 Tax=Synchytrium endobioticum TaxID=286115 RepID=A0A507D2C3_9FUNG|nr:hypothetical protein SeLEV6574_g03766 [Synchytrium endobioticum]